MYRADMMPKQCAARRSSLPIFVQSHELADKTDAFNEDYSAYISSLVESPISNTVSHSPTVRV